MTESWKTAVLNFDPISLEEMDAVKLMDRTDTKFIFHENDLPLYLDSIVPHYRILEIAGSRFTRYENIYFDTEKLDFYLDHHNERMNRFKVRYRRYAESGLSFFEIKYKSNKERTVKERVKTKEIIPEVSGKARSLYNEVVKPDPGEMHPRLWVDYSRMTFVSKAMNERLTMDIGLHYRSGEKEKKINNLVIAEVKQQRASAASPFVKLMHSRHIRPFSISKYCLGITQVYPWMKKNNFKPKLLTINKLTHDLENVA